MRQIVMVGLSAFGMVTSAFSQGSLTLPGIPAPGDMTRSQVAPRKAIIHPTAVAISPPGAHVANAVQANNDSSQPYGGVAGLATASCGTALSTSHIVKRV